MRVRFDATLPLHALEDVATLSAIYADVEVCAGLQAFPPFVIFVRGGSLYKYGWQAVYFDSPPLVLLDGPQIENARHEFIHHLLQMNTGDKDINHVSRFFTPLATGGCA